LADNDNNDDLTPAERVIKEKYRDKKPEPSKTTADVLQFPKDGKRLGKKKLPVGGRPTDEVPDRGVTTEMAQTMMQEIVRLRGHIISDATDRILEKFYEGLNETVSWNEDTNYQALEKDTRLVEDAVRSLVGKAMGVQTFFSLITESLYARDKDGQLVLKFLSGDKPAPDPSAA
jgi:hypothetical protein